MLAYILAYLIAGAAVSLAHPWIRHRLAECWQGNATGTGVIQKPFFGMLGISFYMRDLAYCLVQWAQGSQAREKPFRRTSK